MKVLEEQIPKVPAIPQGTALIYDAMVLTHKLPTALTTFGDISSYIIKQITIHQEMNCVFFVTDNYLENSIKDTERIRRGTDGLINIKRIHCDQKKPKRFNKFLADSNNKVELIRFLLSDWSDPLNYTDAIRGKNIYFTIGPKCKVLTVSNNQVNVQDVKKLFCDQEEADTKVKLNGWAKNQLQKLFLNTLFVSAKNTVILIHVLALVLDFTALIYAPLSIVIRRILLKSVTMRIITWLNCKVITAKVSLIVRRKTLTKWI